MTKLQPTQSTGADDLLATKLRPPRLPSELVRREALFARLEEGLECKFTLLSAPAGFGKSTLASQWLSQRVKAEGEGMKEKKLSPGLRFLSPDPAPVAWFSLDAADNDPVRFWRYVFTACQVFQPDLGETSLEMLSSVRQPSFEAILTAFINELTQLPGRSILVLEDYHLITSPQIHQALAFLLDHLPITLHLVLLTRSDPPLPLARLRARGDLNELRSVDLRFSPAETRSFLQQTLPVSLSPEVAARLETQTEGWAAGLRLATLALQGRPAAETEHFLETLAGSHRHILEYLVEEVLEAQPEPLQTFLLQTTGLGRLTASLADAVIGRSDSQAILAELERANLFLTPLDGARQWYRYHPLFAEAMQHEARRRLGEAELAGLNERASVWYERHDFLSEAIETALSSQAFTRAAGLIKRILGPGSYYEEVHTLRRWLEYLPDTVLRGYPALCLAYAVAILFTEDRRSPATAALLEKPLRWAEEGWQAGENRPKLGEALAFRAMVSWWQGDQLQAFELARQALALLPEEALFWRGVALLHQGLEEWLDGRLNQARQTLPEARVLNEAAGNVHGVMAATFLLGEVYAGQGELHQAAELQRRVLAEAEQVEVGEPLEDKAQALVNLAALAYEWNNLELAQTYAAQALDIGQQLDQEHFLAHSSLVLARIRQANGETTPAQQMLKSLIAWVKQPLLLRQVQAGLARLYLAAGDTAAAQRWSATYAQAGENVPRIQQEREAILHIRLLIHQGETEPALALLKPWQAEAESQGRSRSGLEMIILEALAHSAGANLTQAKERLEHALALARPAGYQRLFLDEGAPLVALLKTISTEAPGEESPDSYARRLLDAAVREHGTAAPFDSPAAQLVEPLSSQEMRVLRLLAVGLSNPEIAEELIVSVNTIKTQVQSIYRKLDVHSREEAGDVARQLKLL